MWIYTLTVCFALNCPVEDQRVIRSPEAYSSLGDCQSMSWVAEKVIESQLARVVVDNSCELQKEPDPDCP